MYLQSIIGYLKFIELKKSTFHTCIHTFFGTTYIEYTLITITNFSIEISHSQENKNNLVRKNNMTLDFKLCVCTQICMYANVLCGNKYLFPRKGYKIK